MDNEIVIVGKNMMIGPKWFCLRNLLTTLYIYFMENWGALKINNYL